VILRIEEHSDIADELKCFIEAVCDKIDYVQSSKRKLLVSLVESVLRVPQSAKVVDGSWLLL